MVEFSATVQKLTLVSIFVLHKENHYFIPLCRLEPVSSVVGLTPKAKIDSLSLEFFSKSLLARITAKVNTAVIIGTFMDQ